MNCYELAAGHMHRFIALDRPFGTREKAEARARIDPPFDPTGILLHTRLRRDVSRF